MTVASLLAKFDTGRMLDTAVNPPELLAEHERVTGGVKRFRFPPEPNGYLHIGHAKSMFLNFGTARELSRLCAEAPGGAAEVGGHAVKGGWCYLRYDDTNPEAENHEFINAIAEMAGWLGWKPNAVTYCSDYFPQLLDFATALIRADRAFVDHSTPAEIKAQRADGTPSPWRSRPIEASLAGFEAMKSGLYGAGEATLRLKIDAAHVNVNMRDPVAYRIKYVPHPRTGDRYCVYPTYDYSHCVVDSLEHIDYSLCTLEFESRREPYYWILWALGLYRPTVWEFGRLNVTDACLSKRNINALVRAGKVRGWTDPRLMTLAALRRRGIPPAAINAFVEQVGITRATAAEVDGKLLEHCAREVLNADAPRVFCCPSPLRLRLRNVAAAAEAARAEGKGDANGAAGWVDAPLFPADAVPAGITVTSRRLELGGEVFIDAADFRLTDEKGYFRLAPGKTVGLRFGPNVTARDVVWVDAALGAAGGVANVAAVECEVDFVKAVKPKAHIQWVPGGAGAAPCTLRHYGRLYPPTPRDILDTDPNGEVEVKGAVLERFAADAPVGSAFQFERLGYYVVDPDSRSAAAGADVAVFVRTVALREAKDKA